LSRITNELTCILPDYWKILLKLDFSSSLLLEHDRKTPLAQSINKLKLFLLLKRKFLHYSFWTAFLQGFCNLQHPTEQFVVGCGSSTNWTHKLHLHSKQKR